MRAGVFLRPCLGRLPRVIDHSGEAAAVVQAAADAAAVGLLGLVTLRITAADTDTAPVEAYRTWHRRGWSPFGRPLLPGSVNRALAVVRVTWNLGRRGVSLLPRGMPRENCVSEIGFEPPHDERDRVFSADEIARILDHTAEWLRPTMVMAYQTGLRRGEIVSLQREHVDLKRGIIRLCSGEAKTREGGSFPALLR
jgi:integrase